jgi:hypothetical protein
MPLTTNIYGQVVSRRDVELAVIDQLQTWIPAAVAEIERQAGLPTQTIPLPPDPDVSYRGGLDFLTFEVGWCPCLITIVQPLGAPAREYSNKTYRQMFEVRVAGVVVEQDEDTARQYADYYGAAIMMAIGQNGSLGTFANGNPVALGTVMTGYPTTEFWNPDERRVIRSVVTFETEIDSVLTGAAGPAKPPANPYQLPGDWPSVDTVNVTTGTQALS